MSPEDSITIWLHQFQAGDRAAAQQLWERYCRRLIGLARKQLKKLPRRAAADEEDVALSAFDSFCRRAEEGQFPQLADRDNLWRLLFAITDRKAKKLVRDERRIKRGGGKVAGESALGGPDGSSGVNTGLDRIAGPPSTPDEEIVFTDEFRHLLDCLESEELRAIALAKMMDETNEQIADRLGCAPKTIERKLKRIRHRWEKELAP